MIGVRLSAVDALFFRDGTPFASEGTAQVDVGGLFPPSPESIVGALRAALARYNGWDGRSRQWPVNLNAVLGNGTDDLGHLRFEGPFLLQDGVPLVPVPRHVLGKTEGEHWRPAALVGPGSPVVCDLGDEIRLPEVVRNDQHLSPRDLKTGDGYWMRLDALQWVLRGELPPATALVPQDCLWRVERRIGLERDPNRRTAREGRLYSARYVRPDHRVSIGVRIHGIPDHWKLPLGSLIPLGGEGRLVDCEPWEARELGAVQVPLEDAFTSGRVMVIALTPLILGDLVCKGRAPITELGGARVVSACLDRPHRVGGWNSSEKAPSPMRSVLPAGSVLFCEVNRKFRLDASVGKATAFARIGQRTAHGYGVVAIGVWPA